MLHAATPTLTQTQNSLINKLKEEYWQNKKTNELSRDYSWQIKDIYERLNQQDFVIFKLAEEIEKLTTPNKE